MSDIITHNHDKDGIDRRGFLKCMAWAGTGVLWSMQGGILTSRAFGQGQGAPALPADPAKPAPPAARTATLDFVQISDSHIGFRKAANPDPAATFRETIA